MLGRDLYSSVFERIVPREYREDRSMDGTFGLSAAGDQQDIGTFSSEHRSPDIPLGYQYFIVNYWLMISGVRIRNSVRKVLAAQRS